MFIPPPFTPTQILTEALLSSDFSVPGGNTFTIVDFDTTGVVLGDSMVVGSGGSIMRLQANEAGIYHFDAHLAWEDRPGASNFWFQWLQIVRSSYTNTTAATEKVQFITTGGGEYGLPVGSGTFYMEAGDYARVAVQHNAASPILIDSLQSWFTATKIA
jgi:hypothetical protein